MENVWADPFDDDSSLELSNDGTGGGGDDSGGGDASSFPLLVRLLSVGDWGAALNRLRSHPHEAQFVGWKSQKTSALHCAVHGADESGGTGTGSNHPPLEVVRSLVEAGGGEIVRAQSSSGMTALHLAVARGVENGAMNEVIRLVLRAEASSVPPETGERRDPVTEIKTSGGHTLLGIFRSTWIESVAGSGDTAGLEDALGAGAAASPEELTGALRVLWDRADILLRATAGESVSPSGDHDRLMLHRILSSPEIMPESFMKLAMRICSEQGFERDRLGRVPLAAAATNPGSRYGGSRDEWVYPIKALTETCPSSASMADNNGRLPLHLVIDAGHRSWDTGIEDILLDAPRALATRDAETRLYPFMMAAVDTKTDLTTVFLLLRQNPTLAWGLAEDPPWVKTDKLQQEVERLRGENDDLKSELERLRSQMSSMQVCSPRAAADDPMYGNDNDDLGEHASQKRRKRA